MKVYLDETGDLGWNFSNPFRKGGSSKYLTISYIILPKDKDNIPREVVNHIYEKRKINPNFELKGNNLYQKAKHSVCDKTIELLINHTDISIGAITVKKENVLKKMPHIKNEQNILYSYMLKIALLPKIKKYDAIEIIPDKRSIKTNSKNSCHEYLKAELMFEHNSKTLLSYSPTESHTNKNLIFIDWLSYIVWSNYEDNQRGHYNILKNSLKEDHLFFD